MTKTELFKEAEKIYPTCEHYKLYRCSADFSPSVKFSDGKAYRILRSYSTIVAVFNVDRSSLLVRDYYSATTVQHIHKFKKLLYALFGALSVIYLYNRKDKLFADNSYFKVPNVYANKDFYATHQADDYERIISVFTL